MKWRACAFSALLVSALAISSAIPGRAATPCDGWSMKTLFSGLGILEYLLPDGQGGLLLSSSSNNEIERITPDGTKTVFVPAVNGPGAMVIRGGDLFVTTGDSLQSGLSGTADGTVLRINMASKQVSTYSTGLVMPNGMTFSAAGDAYISRDLGTGAHVVRVPHGDPSHPDLTWANLGDTNGVRVDPTQTWLYVSTTFNQPAEVDRIKLIDPTVIQPVASLASTGNALPKGLDDMTSDPAGNLYITANGSGEVLRLDPGTGMSCLLASGLQNPSSIEFGRGPGWAADHLFVAGFDGTVRELTPPSAGAGTPAPGTGPVTPSTTGTGGATPNTAGAPTTAGLLLLAAALALVAGAFRRQRSAP